MSSLISFHVSVLEFFFFAIRLSDMTFYFSFLMHMEICGEMPITVLAYRLPAPLIQQSGRENALISPHPHPLSNRISTVFGPQWLSSLSGRGLGWQRWWWWWWWRGFPYIQTMARPFPRTCLLKQLQGGKALQEKKIISFPLAEAVLMFKFHFQKCLTSLSRRTHFLKCYK